MYSLQKIQLSAAANSLAHLLISSVQPNLIIKSTNYENETDLCIVPTSEQSITEVSLSFQQVHLQPREESVFQNVLCQFMDKCTQYAILLQRGV